MADVSVYAEWSWTCDDCGASEHEYGDRETAALDGEQHECGE